MEKQVGNILIVDDEPQIRDAISLLLRPYYQNIYTAANGMLALAVIDKEQVDCVLSDIKMPIMDGISLIKRVREKKIAVPFIFFTGYGNNELMLEALKYGAFDFVNKPDFENLESIVQKGIDSNYQHKSVQQQEEFLSDYQKLLQSEKNK